MEVSPSLRFVALPSTPVSPRPFSMTAARVNSLSSSIVADIHHFAANRAGPNFFHSGHNLRQLRPYGGAQIDWTAVKFQLPSRIESDKGCRTGGLEIKIDCISQVFRREHKKV